MCSMRNRRQQKIRSTRSRESRSCNRNLTSRRSSRGESRRITRTSWSLLSIAWPSNASQTLKLQGYTFFRAPMMRGWQTFIREVSNRHPTTPIISLRLQLICRPKTASTASTVARTNTTLTSPRKRMRKTSLWQISDRYSRGGWCRDGLQLLLTGSNSKCL